MTKIVSIHRSHFQKPLYFRRFSPLQRPFRSQCIFLFFSHLTSPSFYSYLHYNKIETISLYYFIQKGCSIYAPDGRCPHRYSGCAIGSEIIAIKILLPRRIFGTKKDISPLPFSLAVAKTKRRIDMSLDDQIEK